MTRFGLVRLGNECGAVLISTLALLAVLLITFLVVMTYCLSRYGQHVKEKNRSVAVFLADAGIQRSLSMMSDTSLFPWVPREQTPNGGSMSATSLAWGPYVLVRTEGRIANQTVIGTALIGTSSPDYFDAAVTVCDMTYPFIVAGNTTITGDVYTGPLGMTTGRIRGEGIINENFHVGALHLEGRLSNLRLDSSVWQQYETELGRRRSSATQSFSGTQVWQALEWIQKSKDYAVKVENNLVFENCRYSNLEHVISVFVNGYAEITRSSSLTGLIELVADGPIFLKDSANVDQAILYSRDSIVISGTAHFSGIAISHRQIIVKDNASLSYPALLLFTPKKAWSYDSASIWIGSTRALEGICYVHVNDPERTRDEFNVYLDTGVTFTGAIVSEGSVDLRGRIIGTVVTDRFSYSEPTTKYINWAKDFRIDRTRLSFIPVPPMLASRTSEPRRFSIVRQDLAK